MRFSIDQANNFTIARHSDGGPIYAETDFSNWIVEPYNAASAIPFILLVIYWLWRLQGNYKRHWFLTASLPILLVGGIGGTLYHAFRTQRLFLIMDFMPILFLTLAGGIYFWFRAVRNRQKLWWLLPAAIGGVFSLNGLLWLLPIPIMWRISLGYSMLAGIILLPLLLLLYRTQFYQFGLVAAALFSFGLAVFFRGADNWGLLSMGTHWLWHLMGSVATAFLLEYVYRLNNINIDMNIAAYKPPAIKLNKNSTATN
jgi:hemolysin III